MRNVRLLENANNDGDSFKVAHSEGEQVLRLYFVDCPEKKQYALVNGRLKDQAGYFGGLSIPQTLKLGAEAQTFTERLLRERRFTVHTRWERVYDSERVYALVFFEDGEELSEKLVRSGLCRIHTKGTLMPDGQSEYEFENHLRLMEDEARRSRRGGWGTPKRAGSNH
ncbi:MAG: thermonuclease family protein [Prosthecobacter sp.]